MNMEIKKVIIPIGLQEPVKLLHITDSHLCYVNEKDNVRKHQLADKRRKIFEKEEGQSLEYIKQAISYAQQNNALLVHTGDLLDFVSHGNSETAKEIFENIDWFFIDGNHEFSQYVGEAVEDEAYLQQSLSQVQASFSENIRFTSRLIGGVNLVGMENIYYHVYPGQLEKLKAEVAKGFPIILAMHVPWYTADLYHELMVNRASKTGASLAGCPAEKVETYPAERCIQQMPTKEDMEAFDYIINTPQIKLLLAGHLHFDFETTFKSGLKQFVTGAGYNGSATVFELV